MLVSGLQVSGHIFMYFPLVFFWGGCTGETRDWLLVAWEGTRQRLAARMDDLFKTSLPTNAKELTVS